MNLRNNTILITGATSGIGLALLEEFYKLGNKIIAAGRDSRKLDDLHEKFPSIVPLQAELADQDSVENLISEIHKNHQDLNILVNNAGVQYNYEFGRADENYEKIENEIRVNFISPLQLCYRLIPLLEKHKEAAIVNVSSGLGLVPKKSAPVYCGTKGGLHLFTKALRYQLEGSNIKVFEIIPPLVATKMTDGRGSGKITAEQLTREFMKNFERDRFEMNIGKVKFLRIIQRISPRIADNILENA